jgi:hypothetical protein
MDTVQKHIYSNYSASSEPYRVYSSIVRIGSGAGCDLRDMLTSKLKTRDTI